MREKSGKEEKLEKAKGKKKEKYPLKRKNIPLRLDALFNDIVEHGMSEETTKMYSDLDEVDKATIEEGIVKYMVNFCTSLAQIEDWLLNDLKSFLSVRGKRQSMRMQK